MKITKEMLGFINPKSRIGIMLSGGMDSALLLYLLADTFSNEITPFTVPKTDGAALYVNGIIEWVNNKTNREIPNSKFIGDPNLYHGAIINNAIKEINKEYDFLYFAGNSYPEDVLPNGPKRVRRKDPRHFQPFFDCYKNEIVKAYVDFDIMDLIPLTHTCTEQAEGRCNVCWQCKERIWAFNEINIEDTSLT